MILPLAHGSKSRTEFQGTNRSRHAKPTALYGLDPSMQDIKPSPKPEPGTCSLGQDRQSEFGISDLEAAVRLQSTQQALPALRKIPQDVL